MKLLFACHSLDCKTLHIVASVASDILVSLEHLDSLGYLPEPLIRNARTWSGTLNQVIRLLDAAGAERSIFEVIQISQRMQCSDDRDRLFALLSLGEGHLLRPNYGLSTAETYIAFATHMVQHGAAAKVLSIAGDQWRIHRAEATLISLGLPSWVPNLLLDINIAPRGKELLVNSHVIGHCFIASARLCRWDPKRHRPCPRAQSGDYLCKAYHGSRGVVSNVLRPTDASEVSPMSFTVVDTYYDFQGSARADDSWEQEIHIF